MAINSKSTKAEILAAYQELLAIHESQRITAPAVRNTVQAVARETLALAEDIAKLGGWGRHHVTELVKMYNRPVLRAR